VPTPANRVPVRVARGNKATLVANLSKLYEGELAYALDESALYCLDNGELVSVAGTQVVSVNGQTGNVILGMDDLDDVISTNVQNGDMLVYANGSWITTPATAGGTVFSVDVTGDGNVVSTGGPITSTGVIELSLSDTGVVSGEYIHPKVTVDSQGRITAIEAGVPEDQNLGDLLDVDIPLPGIGDVLSWNGISWVSSSSAGGGGSSDVEFLTDLADVSVTSVPSAGQALVWDSSLQEWVPGTPAITFPEVDLGVNDLNNVDYETTSIVDGNVLAWDSSTNFWRDTPVQPEQLSSIKDVDLTGLENNFAIIWDERNDKWIPGIPGTEGTISDEVRVGNTSDQPMHGPGTALDSQQILAQGWIKINTYSVVPGFDATISGEDIADAACFSKQPDDSLMFGGRYIQTGQSLGAYRQAPKFGKGDEVCYVNGTCEYVWNEFRVSVYHALSVGPSTSSTPAYTNPFDPEVSVWNNADVEFTIFPQEADAYALQIESAYVHKSVSWEGENWTIFRRECYANNDTSLHWITETWISENLDVRILHTTDYTVVTSPNPYPDSQGIYQGGGERAIFTGIPNNQGEWEGLTTDGDYAITIKETVLPPPRPEYRIGELSDVTLTNPVDGQVLKYDVSTGEWLNEEVGGLQDLNSSVLGDLGDVALPNPLLNQVLLFNGSIWVASDAPAGPQLDLSQKSIDDLGDVNSTSASNGQYLQWSGSQWVPVDLPSGIDLGSESIDELVDVDTVTDAPEVGQALVWDGSNWVPGNVETDVDVPESIDDLVDVDTVSGAPQDGDSLIYDAAHSKWVPGPPRATQGAPTQTSFPGIPGQMRFDADKLYVCVAPNTWKEVELSAVGGGGGPDPDPEIGDIVDGGNFTTGAAGTINTVLDGGDFTSGLSGDLQDHVADGGVITPGTGGNTPGPDDAIDGGDFTDGTGDGNEFLMDGGNFTTGQAGSADITIDGGLITGNGPAPDPTPGPDDAVDGGDFTQGGDTGSDFTMDGGNFTTGQSGSEDVTIDGGDFGQGGNIGPGPDDSIDGGDFTQGGNTGSGFTMNGGNFTTGESGSEDATIDGGLVTGGGGSAGPGPDDSVDGGDFSQGGGAGSDFTMNGGNFTTGESGTDGTLDGGDFSDDGVDATPANGGDFTTGNGGSVDEIVDGGNFSVEVAGNGGNFSTGEGGTVDEVIDGGIFTAG